MAPSSLSGASRNWRKGIANINVRISHLVRSDSTLGEVTVRLADNVQIMARDRDPDALKAIFRALERARVQVSQSLRRARRRQMMEALTGGCPL